jgi:hypothetical protein
MRIRVFIRRFIFGDFGPPPLPDIPKLPVDVGVKKIIKDLFGCVLIVNLVAYFAFAFALVAFQPSRATCNRLASVVDASWLLLLTLSAALLFFDRRAAGRGFLVLSLGLIIASLFPEL